MLLKEFMRMKGKDEQFENVEPRELNNFSHRNFNYACFVRHLPQLERAAGKSICYSISFQRNKDNLFDSLCVIYRHIESNYVVQLLLQTWNDLFLSSYTRYTVWQTIPIPYLGARSWGNLKKKNFPFPVCTIIWKALTLCSPVCTSCINWPWSMLLEQNPFVCISLNCLYFFCEFRIWANYIFWLSEQSRKSVFFFMVLHRC